MSKVRTVAFYLPQFHEIPENDSWWGKGFTEWTNLATRSPKFKGHVIISPTTLGEYNLVDNDHIIEEQTKLAKKYGVDAFCFYFYWFDGKRLLERPLNSFLESKIDFSFCISWANENWTRRWDGKNAEVLISQKYDDSTAEKVFDSFEIYLKDPRYLRQGDSKILIVHRASHIPDCKLFVAKWRELARQKGIGELHLIAAETEYGLDPRNYGFDAVAEFPPVGANTLSSAMLKPPPKINPKFKGRLMSYPRVTKRYMQRKRPDFVRYSGVMPSWDNTARRKMHATIYLGSNPSLFSLWIHHAIENEQNLRKEEGIVFINAWNEWAESSVLEPNQPYGTQNLEAVLRVIPYENDLKNQFFNPFHWFQIPWLISMVKASFSSCLNLYRNINQKIKKL